jgi:ABC-type polar amino acid transport system ATPase subunit
MLRVDRLVKRFDSHEIISGISLDVARGEVAVILGPSGGGKSTFLRCINGLELFQGGSVTVDDLLLTADTPAAERQSRLLAVRRKVGMVFQQFHLFPHKTALGNVTEAPVRVLGKPREVAEQEAIEFLERVGMGHKLHALPDTLSGGQQQRVAIARALAMGPSVILFDEPTSALDPRMAAEVEEVMSDLAKSGQTMVVVTHSLGLARRCGHKLHIFEGGACVESGTPAEILDSPTHAATRQFVQQAGGH